MKKCGILGLGISGISSAKFLSENGYEVFCWDDNEENIESFSEENKTNSNIRTSNFDEWAIEGFEFILFSPGIPSFGENRHQLAKLAEKSDIPVICDIEVLYKFKRADSKLIGITGTNGKSTTTALINHILKENGKKSEIGGNFGIAALSLDLENTDYLIIEISSYQLDILKGCKFDVAILLNITPDHIDRYGNFEKYSESKERIFTGQNNGDIAIIETGNSESKSKLEKLKQGSSVQTIKGFSINDDKYNDWNFPNLAGKHNKENIIAAYEAVKFLGLNDKQIFDAIKSFKPLEHRTELFLKSNNVTFINDSKATNAEATKSALESFDNIHWLAGGVAKEEGIEPLSPYFKKVKKAYFYGECADIFAEQYEKSGFKNYKKFQNLAETIEHILDFTTNLDEEASIVLSPSAASFDEFKNFEERGKFFKNKVISHINS